MPEITMPRLSDTMADGVISAWRKKIGETVTSGDVIAEIETDKAIMELEAYDDGVLERILVDEGVTVAIGTPIGFIGDGSAPPPAEPAPAAVGGETEARPAVPQPAAPTEEPPAPTAGTEPATGGSPDKPRASPLARKLARERGLDLAGIHGSGPNGRITRVDIDAATARRPEPEQVPEEVVPPVVPHANHSEDFVEVPLSRMQAVAAARLTESKQQAPHFYLTSAVDLTDLLEFRTRLNTTLEASGGPKISVNDLIVKAVAVALRANPAVNVSFAGSSLRHYRSVHVGVAVAVPSGLLVPVIRDADRKSVSEIAAESRGNAELARAGKLRSDQMSGATFTVSNLGMYGVEHFAAVINPPEAAILAVGAATEEVRSVDGEFVVRSIVRLTLSCDHRAVDGATGAAFLRDLSALLRDPLRVLA
ncbi:dihydrolipoamide acetyltransferase family protein [Pseudonocardia spinosispora]|uniref:dihydrolipoamide acetyltransferase family protein n=1 Tax=Pseudonocardia spinosispora TaxID=103441 RepID=UPI000401C3B3|nr:dihydrolipoamide acetyltransferase family protein [Pseudonocardia spinosispora]